MRIAGTILISIERQRLLPLLILFSVVREHHAYGGEHGSGRAVYTAFCI